jgi:hypothetical protein
MTNLPSIRFNQPIGTVDAGGRVIADPTWWRYWTQQQGATINDLQAGTLTATYDLDHDIRVLSIRNQNGADLAIDELLCWDIHYWLTRSEIIDSRRQNGPTINLTAQIQFAIDSLVAKFVGPPNPATKAASKAGALRFHHSYLVDGLNWHPAIRITGTTSGTPSLFKAARRTGIFCGARSRRTGFRRALSLRADFGHPAAWKQHPRPGKHGHPRPVGWRTPTKTR